MNKPYLSKRIQTVFSYFPKCIIILGLLYFPVGSIKTGQQNSLSTKFISQEKTPSYQILPLLPQINHNLYSQAQLNSPDQETYNLTVEIYGSGIVFSDPVGIDCGIDCTESFEYNTIVTLNATASPGATFSGGGCWDSFTSDGARRRHRLPPSGTGLAGCRKKSRRVSRQSRCRPGFGLIAQAKPVPRTTGRQPVPTARSSRLRGVVASLRDVRALDTSHLSAAQTRNMLGAIILANS